jgi:hypothetical protein
MICFYGEEFLTPGTTPKLEDHNLLAILQCLFNTFAATLTEVFLNLTEIFLTLTEVFPWLFLSCKANARVKTRKDVARPALFHISCYLCCSVYCLCVNVYCHRVTTQLQLINISNFKKILNIAGRFSIRNVRTRHALVTGTHLSRPCPYIFIKCNIVSCLSLNCQVFCLFGGFRENAADGSTEKCTSKEIWILLERSIFLVFYIWRFGSIGRTTKIMAKGRLSWDLWGNSFP